MLDSQSNSRGLKEGEVPRAGRRGVCGTRIRSSSRLVLLLITTMLAWWGMAPRSAEAACSLPHQLTNGDNADASQVMDNFNALLNCIANMDNPLFMSFVLSNGSAGTNVGPILLAPRQGSFTKCKVVVKNADGTTPLTFRILQNGTNIFTTDPIVPAGTSSKTVVTFTALTNSPLAVTADDLFTIDVISGTPFWQVTIQVE